jgi:hypothetical protein
LHCRDKGVVKLKDGGTMGTHESGLTMNHLLHRGFGEWMGRMFVCNGSLPTEVGEDVEEDYSANEAQGEDKDAGGTDFDALAILREVG